MLNRILKICLLLLCTAAVIWSCQKDTSYESGKGLGGMAQGTLQDSSGNCQSITINGTYAAGTPLTDNNYVIVNATITSAGIYRIYTDTANGMWFGDSSYALNVGAQIIKLKGHGKPILPISADFIVHFTNSYCIFTIVPVGATPNTQTSDYFPTTTASTWSYNNPLGTNDTLNITIANMNTLYNGNLYRVFAEKTTLGKDTLYFRKSAGLYYQYGSFVDSSDVVEYIFLKDNVPTGSIWETPNLNAVSLGTPYQFKVRSTILAKDITTTVGGNSYDSVIQVKQEIMQQTTPGNYQTIFSRTQSYAKKIGLIDYNFSTYTPAPYDYQLTNYSIK
ncbi:hypothetical protein ACI6Q2_06800 [Chitinophagaceae bacterium LWZ2-11]